MSCAPSSHAPASPSPGASVGGAQPAWRALVQSASLRESLVEMAVSAHFPLQRARHDCSATALSPSPSASPATDAPSRSSSSCRPSTAAAMRAAAAPTDRGIGVAVMRRRCLLERAAAWLGWCKWMPLAERVAQLQALWRRLCGDHPQLVAYFGAKECRLDAWGDAAGRTCSPALLPGRAAATASPSPASTGAITAAMLRHPTVAAELRKWWRAAPKLRGAAHTAAENTDAQAAVVTRATLKQIVCLMHVALFAGPLCLEAPEFAAAVRALAAADVAAVVAESVMAVGPALFGVALLSVVDPWMETDAARERSAILEALRPQVFLEGGGGVGLDSDAQEGAAGSTTAKLRTLAVRCAIPEREAAPTARELFTSDEGTNGAAEGCGDEEEEAPQPEAIATMTTSTSTTTTARDEAVRLAGALDGVEFPGPHSPELRSFVAEHASRSAQLSLPKWRAAARQMRLATVEGAGRRALAPPRVDVQPSAPASAFAVERVLLERLSRQLREGDADPQRAMVARFVATSVIPRDDVARFVRHFPRAVDSFRAAADFAAQHGSREGDDGFTESTDTTGAAPATAAATAAAVNQFAAVRGQQGGRCLHERAIGATRGESATRRRVHHLFARRRPASAELPASAAGTGGGGSRALTNNALPRTLPVWRSPPAQSRRMKSG